uniref:Uncharacterized protein n=1 Tax=Tetranychus urticae TaxID=32264 RepID=T1JV85_TETUR
MPSVIQGSRHEGIIFKAGTEGDGYKLLGPSGLNPINKILATKSSADSEILNYLYFKSPILSAA